MAKAGLTNLVDVLTLLRRSQEGFVFMDSRYDPVAATGQVAGGANLGCFTTGRTAACSAASAALHQVATNTHRIQGRRRHGVNCGPISDGGGERPGMRASSLTSC